MADYNIKTMLRTELYIGDAKKETEAGCPVELQDVYSVKKHRPSSYEYQNSKGHNFTKSTNRMDHFGKTLLHKVIFVSA